MVAADFTAAASTAVVFVAAAGEAAGEAAVGAGPDGAAAGVTGAQVGAGAVVGAIGFDGDSVEAQCFAYCALRSQRDLPISFPTTTGAPKPMTGGVFSPGRT
jgi:hypothetical protein